MDHTSTEEGANGKDAVKASPWELTICGRGQKVLSMVGEHIRTTVQKCVQILTKQVNIKTKAAAGADLGENKLTFISQEAESKTESGPLRETHVVAWKEANYHSEGLSESSRPRRRWPSFPAARQSGSCFSGEDQILP